MHTYFSRRVKLCDRWLAILHQEKAEILSLILQIKEARPGGSISVGFSLPTRIEGVPMPYYKVPPGSQESFFSALLPILQSNLAVIESELVRQNGEN